MMIGGGKGVGNALLISNSISSIHRLTVYRITSNAEGIISLRNQRNIVSARTVACRHCWCNLMGTSISSVNPMVFKYQRLMAVFLCAKCSSDILTAAHRTAALVVEAEDRGHTVSAGGSF